MSERICALDDLKPLDPSYFEVGKHKLCVVRNGHLPPGLESARFGRWSRSVHRRIRDRRQRCRSGVLRVDTSRARRLRGVIGRRRSPMERGREHDRGEDADGDDLDRAAADRRRQLFHAAHQLGETHALLPSNRFAQSHDALLERVAGPEQTEYRGRFGRRVGRSVQPSTAGHAIL